MNQFYETEEVGRFTHLEIQTATDRESAAPLRITKSPEVGRVHVQIEEERVVLCVPIRVIAEIGMVQHVDRTADYADFVSEIRVIRGYESN